ncbi:hypothetical protein LR48_Vigan05g094200 [Vigna angularis]|uniref:Uncharacterized protein n=1 Tax=Phaseolus angularis TaxID=3914 RepID=A0A0L9UKP5_PHAAN|nr:hypothetical protein LR48_Vigan05g094200 [Vigna angularis]
MAEPSRRRRRRTSEVSESTVRRRDATIEGWLSDEQDQQSFSQFWKERKLIKQKFIDLAWQMGFIKQGLSYIHPEDALGGPEHEDEAADIPMPDPTHAAGPSQVHEEYSIESLSRQMTEMARLQNEMMNIQNTRHEEICTHLRNLDTRISGLERHFNSDASDEF